MYITVKFKKHVKLLSAQCAGPHLSLFSSMSSF